MSETYPQKKTLITTVNQVEVRRLVTINNDADYQKLLTLGSIEDPTEQEIETFRYPVQQVDSTAFIKAQAEAALMLARTDISIPFYRPGVETEENPTPDQVFMGTIRLHKQWHWDEWQGQTTRGQGTIWFTEEKAQLTLTHVEMVSINDQIATIRYAAFATYWGIVSVL